MQIKKLLVSTLLVMLPLLTLACDETELSPSHSPYEENLSPVASAPKVVESFILAANSLDLEEMARYCVPEKRRDIISELQTPELRYVTSVSNHDIHTELVSETEYTAEVHAEWIAQAECNTPPELELFYPHDGGVPLCRMGEFGLDKRNGEWFITVFETQDNQTDRWALQSAVYAFYYEAGKVLPTADGGAGDIDWYASDGAGQTFIGGYLQSIPDSDPACDWHITDNVEVIAANSCPCYNPLPDYPEWCRLP